jgi:hypothetical protein
VRRTTRNDEHCARARPLPSAKQGEIGLVIADEYFAIRDYKEPKR